MPDDLLREAEAIKHEAVYRAIYGDKAIEELEAELEDEEPVMLYLSRKLPRGTVRMWLHGGNPPGIWKAIGAAAYRHQVPASVVWKIMGWEDRR